MRKIKFRMWDPDKKVFTDCMDPFTFDIKIALESIEDGLINQFTGLLDKNGTEIYEGDIWQDDEGYLGQIKDSNYGWIVTDLDALYDCLAYGKVIGNIYENPEMLKS